MLAALLLLGLATPVLAQGAHGRIAGVVTSEDTGEPVPGVQVFIENTRHAVVTGQDGRYALPNVDPGIYRVGARRLGFVASFQDNVRVEAGVNTTVNLALASQALSIEATIVTGTVDPVSGLKVPFTVARVSAEDMPVATISSGASAIQGKVAGAQILRASSPGSGAYIQLRSPSSIYGSNGPLYVVDGVILSSDFDRTTVDIESLDIESVEVIKGAAAASLYGSRANNGVIAITTKRGNDVEAGKTKVSLRSEFGVNSLGNDFNIARNAHYFATNEEGQFVDGTGAVLENPLSGRIVNSRRMMDVPWGPVTTYDNIDRFYKAGNFRGNTFTISQNASNTNFNVSFSDYLTTGVLEGNDGFARRSGRVNVDHRPTNKFSIRFTGYHMRSYRDNIAGEPFEDLLRYLPDVDLSLPGTGDEPYVIQPAMPFLSTVNPLYFEWANDNSEKRSRTQASAAARFTPLSWLTLDADLGYDRSDRLIQEYIAKGVKMSSDDENGVDGRYRVYTGATNSYTATVTGTVLKAFGPLTARTYYRGVLERADNHTNDMIGENLAVKNVRDLSVAIDRTLNSNITETRANGHMVATALDYGDKYIADLLIRRDGSSLFGPAERWQTYYRAAGNWRVSKEPWFNVPGVSEFQLRFSRGTAGGRPGFAWQYETFNVSNAGLISKGTLGNRFLRPEHTTENDFTIRTIFDKRISVDLAWVTTNTKDQILPVALPGPFGFNTQRRNAGTISGETYEATVEARIINQRNFKWRTNLVLDRSRHRVEHFDRPCYRENMVMYCSGMQMGEFWTTRLHRTPEELAYRHNPAILSQFQTNDEGLLVWVGEGNTWREGLSKNLWGTSAVIDGYNYQWGRPFMETLENGSAKYVKTGDGNADFNFGWGNHVNWRRFAFYALLNGQVGAEIYNSTKGRMYDRWRHEDVDQSGKPEENKKPIDYYRALYNAGLFTDYFIEDGSFAKLSEMSVRYSVPPKFLSRMKGFGFNSASFGLVARNVFTLTNYSGYDPEVGSTFNRRDVNPYPHYRTLTGELRVEF